MLILIEAQKNRDGEFEVVGIIDTDDQKSVAEEADRRFASSTHCRRTKVLDKKSFPYMKWWKEEDVPMTHDEVVKEALDRR